MEQEELNKLLEGKHLVGATFTEGGAYEGIMMTGVRPDQVILAGRILQMVGEEMLKQEWAAQAAAQRQNQAMMDQITRNIAKGA